MRRAIFAIVPLLGIVLWAMILIAAPPNLPYQWWPAVRSYVAQSDSAKADSIRQHKSSDSLRALIGACPDTLDTVKVADKAVLADSSTDAAHAYEANHADTSDVAGNAHTADLADSAIDWRGAGGKADTIALEALRDSVPDSTTVAGWGFGATGIDSADVYGYGFGFADSIPDAYDSAGVAGHAATAHLADTATIAKGVKTTNCTVNADSVVGKYSRFTGGYMAGSTADGTSVRDNSITQYFSGDTAVTLSVTGVDTVFMNSVGNVGNLKIYGSITGVAAALSQPHWSTQASIFSGSSTDKGIRLNGPSVYQYFSGDTTEVLKVNGTDTVFFNYSGNVANVKILQTLHVATVYSGGSIYLGSSTKGSKLGSGSYNLYYNGDTTEAFTITGADTLYLNKTGNIDNIKATGKFGVDTIFSPSGNLKESVANLIKPAHAYTNRVRDYMPSMTQNTWYQVADTTTFYMDTVELSGFTALKDTLFTSLNGHYLINAVFSLDAGADNDCEIRAMTLVSGIPAAIGTVYTGTGASGKYVTVSLPCYWIRSATTSKLWFEFRNVSDGDDFTLKSGSVVVWYLHP